MVFADQNILLNRIPEFEKTWLETYMGKPITMTTKDSEGFLLQVCQLGA